MQRAFGLTPDESEFPGREAGGEGEGSILVLEGHMQRPGLMRSWLLRGQEGFSVVRARGASSTEREAARSPREGLAQARALGYIDESLSAGRC